MNVSPCIIAHISSIAHSFQLAVFFVWYYLEYWIFWYILPLNVIFTFQFISIYLPNYMPIPVAARSKVWFCGRCSLGLWVRIPPGTWMFVSCKCCVLSGVKYRSLWRAGHLYRGVLPNVVFPMTVIVKPRKGRPWAGTGSKRHRKERKKKTQFACDVQNSTIFHKFQLINP
jgi:hypothetical protein